MCVRCAYVTYALFPCVYFLLETITDFKELLILLPSIWIGLALYMAVPCSLLFSGGLSTLINGLKDPKSMLNIGCWVIQATLLKVRGVSPLRALASAVGIEATIWRYRTLVISHVRTSVFVVYVFQWIWRPSLQNWDWHPAWTNETNLPIDNTHTCRDVDLR